MADANPPPPPLSGVARPRANGGLKTKQWRAIELKMTHCTFILLFRSVHLFFNSFHFMEEKKGKAPELLQNTGPRGPIMLLTQGRVQLFGCNFLRNTDIVDFF